MTYHISLFDNRGYDAVTANPAANRDTYFVRAGLKLKPDHNVEINVNGGSWRSYNQAFGNRGDVRGANFIWTGTRAYLFWDNTNSGINAVTQERPNDVLNIFNGGAGDLVLTINADGSISFAKV
jgi:hypothetical protein